MAQHVEETKTARPFSIASLRQRVDDRAEFLPDASTCVAAIVLVATQ